MGHRTLGDVLKEARKKVGYTQKRVETITGINHKTLGGYENNVAEPDLATLNLLADTYGCPVESFVKFTKNGPAPKSKRTKLDELEYALENDLPIELDGVVLDDVEREHLRITVQILKERKKK